MLRNVHIKLTRSSIKAGPFDIYDEYGNLLAENISRDALINGITFLLDETVTLIKIISKDACAAERIVPITTMTEVEFYSTETTTTSTGCVWRHLVTATSYNTYYGKISPYIIEYPFSYSPQDEILQSFKDYTNVYQYVEGYDASFSTSMFVELDDVYFNKMIVYNNQQCSGLLKLVPKPLHNLNEYMRYPIYNSDSKTILFAKSDNFYQINGMYDVLSDKKVQMFIPSCENLSIDKILNQDNMIYTQRAFMKAPLRAKDNKIRLCLDDRSDVHLVSRFTLNLTQISYK